MLKRDPRQLAIAGGTPAFATPLFVGRPNIGDRQQLLDALTGILDRGWLTNNGPVVQAFEAALTRHLGVKHCIPVCNATIGLEVAVRALGLTGEVIVPAFTFVATAHAVRWLGLEPVFADVDPATHTLDAASVERAITPRTSAILGVHLWGRACDVAALEQIAQRHGLTLYFDAAHAFSCDYLGRMIGHFGALEVFSFHATKFLNSFEGGAIATNSDELAAAIRLMINFGFAGYDTVTSLGINAKMSEISAAMGLLSLEGIAGVIAINQRNYRRYASALQGLDGVSLLEYDPRQRNNYQYVVVELEAREAGLSRDELMRVLWAEGVHARRYFHPGCHRMAPYAADARWRNADLPATDRLAQRVLVLPTGSAIGDEEVDAIAAIIRTALSAPQAVRDALEQAAPSAP